MIGPTGPVGETGPKGDQGVKGDKGNEGEKGQKVSIITCKYVWYFYFIRYVF